MFLKTDIAPITQVAIDLGAVHEQLVAADQRIEQSAIEHSVFLKKLGLPPA